MSKIKVLVVDDSAVVRRLISEVLSADPEIDVVGVAENGRVALKKIAELRPDLITLDVEMPELDGIETVREIRKTDFLTRIIMVSSLTAPGVKVTLDALEAGATDFITKPTGRSREEAIAILKAKLVPRVKALVPRRVLAPVGATPAKPLLAQPLVPKEVPGRGRRVGVVVIAISTGGPAPLMDILGPFPGNFPVPVLIVQHMPAEFTKFLADRLGTRTAMRVGQAQGGEPIAPGQAWLAPGGFHLEVVRRGASLTLDVNEKPPENHCRPAADVLFRSAAEHYGDRTLAVVLTGMGQDGLRGCEQIRKAGGQVVVQDEKTSVVWGMPGSVAKAGLADRILPLPLIGPEIARRVASGRTVAAPPGAKKA